jgi:mono/diheme cytochrome c family protein/DNA-binding beta-propeller fold protein YncE
MLPNRNIVKGLTVFAGMISIASLASADPATENLYKKHCAECHGADRLGGMGPALLPQNLKRLRKKKAVKVIAQGRLATQMPAFGDKLSDDEIAGLTKFIYTKLPYVPEWGKAEIEATRNIAAEVDKWIKSPLHKSDPLNLFVVVEAGDHHVTILDGDTFTPIHRFESRFALHGGPKFTPDGRFVYFASRDGWITKFDLYTLEIIAEVRAGINTRNMAISSDGATLAVANYLPHTLVLLNAEDLRVEKIFNVKTKDGQSSRVSAVYQARPRKSFIAALKDVPEAWEISTDTAAANTDQGMFALKRIKTGEPLDDFFFDQPYRHMLGSSRDGKSARVVDMSTGKTIRDIALPGLPHMGSGITFNYKGKRVMATPHLRSGRISVIDMDDWSVIKTIKTRGPGFFMRSHEKSPYAWAGVFFGPNRDLVHIIDKRTLEIVKTLRPVPGKTAAHVEFDKTGEHALLSVWDMDGVLIVYDAKTFKEVKRLKMVKPAGKYNVYNKINFSEGTSH